MDGDLGNRASHFLANYGSKVNINNEVMFNTSTLNIVSDRKYYENKIDEAIKDGKNIKQNSSVSGFIVY